jgi:hypothetical protein
VETAQNGFAGLTGRRKTLRHWRPTNSEFSGGVIKICTRDRAIATDPSQLIPQYAQKFQQQIGLGEWPAC